MTELPPFPVASDYQGRDRERFRAGIAAAKRYYKACERNDIVDYCGYIERADARREPGAWYDGFDSIANFEYFQPKGA